MSPLSHSERGFTLQFFLTDYWYFGHARVIDGIPYDRGFTQGFGFFAVEARWVSKKRRAHLSRPYPGSEVLAKVCKKRVKRGATPCHWPRCSCDIGAEPYNP